MTTNLIKTLALLRIWLQCPLTSLCLCRKHFLLENILTQTQTLWTGTKKSQSKVGV